MVATDAESVSAHLQLRGLLHGTGALAEKTAAAGAEDEEWGGPSAFHKRFKDEISSTLKGGLDRRLKRLKAGGGKVPAKFVPPPRAPFVAPEPPDPEEVASDMKKLATSVGKAMTDGAKPAKAFGPTRTQRIRDFDDPNRDKEKERSEIYKETVTMKATLVSLKKQVKSRVEQIASLKEQITTMKDIKDAESAKAALARDNSLAAELNPDDVSALARVQAERIAERRTSAETLRKEVAEAKRQAQQYREIVQQQRAFVMQSNRLVDLCGRDALSKSHPAGEVFLAPKPVGVDDFKAWDVGSYVSNPYVTDSWPFEPNVQARRSTPEAPMTPCGEETREDLEEPPEPLLALLSFGTEEDDEGLILVEVCEDDGADLATLRAAPSKRLGDLRAEILKALAANELLETGQSLELALVSGCELPAVKNHLTLSDVSGMEPSDEEDLDAYIARMQKRGIGSQGQLPSLDLGRRLKSPFPSQPPADAYNREAFEDEDDESSEDEKRPGTTRSV